MKFQKIVSVIISISLVFSCAVLGSLSVSASAANTVYSDSNIQATASQTVSIPIRISDNSGLMGYDMNFTYDDDVLTPVSVTRGNIMTDGFFEDDIEGTTSTETRFRVFWSHAYPSTENGILFYLNFNIDSKAMGSTTLQVGYDKSATFDGNYDDVTLNCSDISIAIINNEYDSNPVFSLSGNNISAGEQLNLDVSVENIGEMESVNLSVPYDNSNFKYSGLTLNGVTASATDDGNSINVTISSFRNKTDGKKLTLKFQSESFATSGKYAFFAEYSNLIGVDRILIKTTEITITPTDESDSVVIYSDEEIVSYNGQSQLIVPLYIKHNTGLLGYTLTFEYDDAIIQAVSAKAGNAFVGSFSNNIGKYSDRFTCLWFGNDDITAEGEFITLTFNIVANQKTSSVINISYNERDIISESVDGVKITVPELTYTVNEDLPYQIGDTNLDGKITIRDVTAIQRHLAELERFADKYLVLADTNGDGVINIIDATHLQKYLAEFDGIVLGKQPTV